MIDKVETYRSLKKQNAGVAARHTSDADRSFYDTVDVIVRALGDEQGGGIPLSQAIVMAADSVAAGSIAPRSEVLGTRRDQDDLAQKWLGSDLINGTNGQALREEFLKRVHTATAVVGTKSVDAFAKEIGRDLKSEYQLIGTATVNMAPSGISAQLVRPISRMAAEIFASENEMFDASEVTLNRNPVTSRWYLVDEQGVGVGGLALSDDDLAAIVDFNRRIDTAKRENTGTNKAIRRAGGDILMREGERRMFEAAREGRSPGEAYRQFQQEIRNNANNPNYQFGFRIQELQMPTFDPNDRLAPFYQMLLDKGTIQANPFNQIDPASINLGGLVQ